MRGECHGFRCRRPHSCELRYAIPGVLSAAPESVAIAFYVMDIITYKIQAYIPHLADIYACFIKKYLNVLKYFGCFCEVVVFYAVEITLIGDSCI